MTNLDQLKQLMADNNLDRRQIAEISGYSIHTINQYFASPDAKQWRRLSDRALGWIKNKVYTWILDNQVSTIKQPKRPQNEA